MKGEKINLIENGKNISNDTESCNIFNGFFSNIISEINISKRYQCFLNDMDSDSVLSVLSACNNHPSIKNIKSKKFDSTFSFENTYTDLVMKVIKNLNVIGEFRGGRGGRLGRASHPNLFFSITCFFAITLKNYKLC